MCLAVSKRAANANSQQEIWPTSRSRDKHRDFVNLSQRDHNCNFIMVHSAGFDGAADGAMRTNCVPACQEHRPVEEAGAEGGALTFWMRF